MALHSDPASQHRSTEVTGGGGRLLEPSHASLAQAICLQTGRHLTTKFVQQVFFQARGRLGAGGAVLATYVASTLLHGLSGEFLAKFALPLYST